MCASTTSYPASAAWKPNNVTSTVNLPSEDSSEATTQVKGRLDYLIRYAS